MQFIDFTFIQQNFYGNLYKINENKNEKTTNFHDKNK